MNIFSHEWQEPTNEAWRPLRLWNLSSPTAKVTVSHDLHGTKTFHYWINNFFLVCAKPWVSWRSSCCCGCKSGYSFNLSLSLCGLGFQKGDTQSPAEGWIKPGPACDLQLNTTAVWCLILVPNSVTRFSSGVDFHNSFFSVADCLLWAPLELYSSLAPIAFCIFKVSSSCPLRFLPSNSLFLEFFKIKCFLFKAASFQVILMTFSRISSFYHAHLYAENFLLFYYFSFCFFFFFGQLYPLPLRILSQHYGSPSPSGRAAQNL